MIPERTLPPGWSHKIKSSHADKLTTNSGHSDDLRAGRVLFLDNSQRDRGSCLPSRPVYGADTAQKKKSKSMQSYSPTPITLTGEWWWGSSAAPHNSSGGRACRPHRSLIFSFFSQDLMGSTLLWKRSNPTSAARWSVLMGKHQSFSFFLFLLSTVY